MAKAGVPVSAIPSALAEAEEKILNAYFAKQKAIRDSIKQNGTSTMASQWGVSERTVRRMKEKALNEIGHESDLS